MHTRTLVLVSLFALLLSTGAWAQSKNSQHTLSLDEGATSPAATLDDIAWLSGYWRGEGLGGQCEEIWGKSIGDQMLGSFSLSKDGKLVFSEAMAIVEEGSSLMLRIKHFSPDFKGWEEKDEFMSFPLVRLGESEAFFSGLTFQRAGDDLQIFVVAEEGEKQSELAFSFKRAQL